ncbi:MAG: 50S ribosomal protein L22 [Candidatus Adlerbacteria bacterium]|nr:50S ribosomal protein L22 [Candidatus Adlerbacteria bacterium]
MATATATLRNYRQSPRKVRLIADLIRGKSVSRALALLANLPKRGAEPMQKLLESAVANAKTPAGELFVSGIEVNGGIVFKRQMPRARGRASLIRKKTSHITLRLMDKPAKKHV